MHRQLMIGWLLCGFWLCGGAATQSLPSSAEELVAAVLAKSDPLHDGNGARELLGPGVALDDAIVATARSTTAARLVRRRALHLARALDLAHRLKVGTQHDVSWWLALHEIDRELPAAIRPLLLARTGLTDPALAAAEQELNVASDTARGFCLDWNETRAVAPTDAAGRETNRRYDELEAALGKAGPAAVPALFTILTVSPVTTFTRTDPEQGISARQQVRAILALSAFLKVPQALPFFVMHTGGPSLTQSADAGAAIQVLSGEDFGAAPLREGDAAAVLQWWARHRGEHEIVLDYLVGHVVRWAAEDLDGHQTQATAGAHDALRRLRSLLGQETTLPADAGVEVLRAQLDGVECEWLQRQRELGRAR